MRNLEQDVRSCMTNGQPLERILGGLMDDPELICEGIEQKIREIHGRLKPEIEARHAESKRRAVEQAERQEKRRQEQAAQPAPAPQPQPQPEAVKPRLKKKAFNPKRGQRPAHKVATQALPRVQLKNYPDYQIDSYGSVYEIETGRRLAPRWRNGKCWVNLWTHEAKRVQRNVYWLLVDAGYVTVKRELRDIPLSV